MTKFMFLFIIYIYYAEIACEPRETILREKVKLQNHFKL